MGMCLLNSTDLEHNSVGIDARHVLHHHKVCFCDAEFDGNLPLRFYLLLVRRRKMVVWVQLLSEGVGQSHHGRKVYLINIWGKTERETSSCHMFVITLSAEISKHQFREGGTLFYISLHNSFFKAIHVPLAVPDRNWILFCRIFRVHHWVWHAVALSFRQGRGSYVLRRHIRYSCIT